jgi:hypothetical protein
MPVVIPSAGTISKAKLTVETLPATPLATLQALTDTSVDQRALAGTLYWNKKKLAWSAGWRIAHDGSEISWGIDGVNFDAAFRNAVGGAAQILSGNGQPP